MVITSNVVLLEEHQPCKPADLGSNPSIGSNLTGKLLWCHNYKKQEAIEEHRGNLNIFEGGNIEIGFSISTE